MYARAVIARGRAEYITSLVSFRPATRLKSHFRDKRRAKYAAETEYRYKLRSQLTYRSSWIVFFRKIDRYEKKKKKKKRIIPFQFEIHPRWTRYYCRFFFIFYIKYFLYFFILLLSPINSTMKREFVFFKKKLAIKKCFKVDYLFISKLRIDRVSLVTCHFPSRHIVRIDLITLRQEFARIISIWN